MPHGDVRPNRDGKITIPAQPVPISTDETVTISAEDYVALFEIVRFLTTLSPFALVGKFGGGLHDAIAFQKQVAKLVQHLDENTQTVKGEDDE